MADGDSNTSNESMTHLRRSMVMTISRNGNNVLLSARDHDDVGVTKILMQPSRCTKLLLRFVLFSMAALVVMHGKESLRSQFGIKMPIKTNNIHQMHSSIIKNDDERPYPQRIAYLDPENKFSFVHISKCAGSTWIRLFKDILKIDICPSEESGTEQSVYYQQNYTCKDADYSLISLRSPRHHVWSQFTMCKYSSWGKKRTTRKGFPRTGDTYEDDEADFDTWLTHFLVNNTHYYNCYHPANFQTRALTSKRRYVGSGIGGFHPNLTLAVDTYNRLDFVALVEFVHESQCMLYYRLGERAPPAAISYLSESCHCDKHHDVNKKNGTIHVQYHNMGKRSNLRDLPLSIQSKVANLTLADSFVYLNALTQFMQEMAWLESRNALGRRVVCDNVLEKWDSELAYLDDGYFNLTQLYQDAVMKQQ